MKIAIAQINTSVGDLGYNVWKMVNAARLVREHNPDLLVFPELAITGYPPQDLLLKPHFIDAQMKAAMDAARQINEVSGIPSLFGFVDSDKYDNLYNAAAFTIGGRIVQVFHKTLLPNYDVFDERRYFKPGTTNTVPLRLGDMRIGVIICEDMWEDGYHTSVIKGLSEAGSRLIINLSASPWNIGKLQTRKNVIARRKLEYGLPVLYVNQVGGQDELIFDGSSTYTDNRNNEPTYMANFCGEEIAILDIATQGLNSMTLKSAPQIVYQRGGIPIQGASENSLLFEALTLGTRDYAIKNNFDAVVLGLSGGIDSTLTAALAKRAGLDVLGISLPSHITDDSSRNEAKEYAKKLGISFTEVPIIDAFKAFNQGYMDVFKNEVKGLPRENLQPRIRGTYLMLVSNMTGRLLLSTGNKTEIALGYCTLYGDMCGGLSVIGDIEKPDVYGLCHFFNKMMGEKIISDFVLERIPTAELEEGQRDPFDYPVISKVVDRIVLGHMSPEKIKSMKIASDAEVEDAFKRIKISQFKRKQSAPILRVSAKAFGMGRRMPIANAFPY